MSSQSKSTCLFLVSIGSVVFFFHFLYLHAFGFYEDDYWAVVPFIGDKLSAIFHLFAEAFQKWPQGRPFNHSLPKVMAVIGMHLGGIGGIYALAYAAFCLNCSLVYLILRRIFSFAPALAGTLVYVAFPADVTRPFLVHAAHVQGGMTFFLLGAWLWFKGGKFRFVGYPMAALSLISYETAFLPFLTLPLLAGYNLRSTWRGLIRHLLICGGIIAAYGIIRYARGESRAVDALGDPLTSLGHMLTSLYLGPLTSATRLIVAPIEGLRLLDPTAWVCALCILFGILTLLRLHRGEANAAPAADASAPKSGYVYLLGCAVLIWSGSYALTLTNYPPTQTMGRLTSTHTAAAWAAAVFCAAFVSVLANTCRTPAIRRGRRQLEPVSALAGF